MSSQRKNFQLMVMEHFKGNLSSDVRYQIIKSEIKDVVKAGREVDQLCAAYASCKNYILYGRRNSAFS